MTSFSPPITSYDLVLDLRELKNQGERAPAADYRFATLTTSGSM